ncbi:hypothetical protein Nepgr_029747 [Nepenthes gracilis]|uniref:Uncharacterized protein n=1 Tax=Nepenthes gracilis TaxID=150966 RepID=A0AAD3TEY1_NEPGR|nr:hypothetical protein Nepgr_029747 [Nepenthes gracilis]
MEVSTVAQSSECEWSTSPHPQSKMLGAMYLPYNSLTLEGDSMGKDAFVSKIPQIQMQGMRKHSSKEVLCSPDHCKHHQCERLSVTLQGKRH